MKNKTSEKAKILGAVGMGMGIGLMVSQGASVTNLWTHAQQAPSWTDNASVPQFNGALGVLTGVQVTLVGSLKGNLFVENGPGANNAITMSLKGDVGSTIPSNGGLSVQPSVSVSDVLSANESKSYLNLMGSVTNSAGMGNLVPFVGGGNVLIPVSASLPRDAFSLVGNQKGQTGGFSEATLGAVLSVVYTYAPIPEAETWVVGALAMVAMAVWYRRK